MDETYIQVKGAWRYLYRAVDKSGQTIDFLLTEARDEPGRATLFHQGDPPARRAKKYAIDGSEANAAAIKRYNEAHGTAIDIRQVKYLEQCGGTGPPRREMGDAPHAWIQVV